MKKRLIFLSTTLFLISLFMMGGLERNVFLKNLDTERINERWSPSIHLLKLLELTGLEHDGSLNSIVKATQDAWIRKLGTERYDLIDTQKDNRDEFLNIFHKLGLIDDIDPQSNQYDYVLFMGATYYACKKRLTDLIELWEKGIWFNQIVILSGSRPLTEFEKKIITEEYNLVEGDFIPSTEVDMIKFIFKKLVEGDFILSTEVDMIKSIYKKMEILAAIKEVESIVINVPMKLTKDGVAIRPTAADTIDLWLESKPLAGSCLVVSNQPYVKFHDSVVKTLVPKNFNIETCGKKSTNVKIPVYLDNIARYLYQEKKRLEL